MATINFRQRLGTSLNGGPFICILTLFFAICVSGQSDKSNSAKADENLKGSTRVNPSTLAMEFSLPLGVHPGRAGNSMPIVLNYSSKLWSASIIDSEYTDTAITHPGNPPYPRVINDFKTAVFGYGGKSNAGWNASLQPPRIIQSNSFFLERPDPGASFGSGSIAEQEVEFGEDLVDILAGTSESVFSLTECGTQLSHSGNICEVCMDNTDLPGGQWDIVVSCWRLGTSRPPTRGGPRGSGTTANTAVASFVKRVMIQMPDGTVVEFRKDDVRIQCGFLASGNQNCALNLTGTYLSVDGSRMRFAYGEPQPNGSTRHVLYLPDGSRYLFPYAAPIALARFTEAEEYRDRNGNTQTYDRATGIWTNTLGVSIQNPFPPGLPAEENPSTENTQSVSLPSMAGTTRGAQLVWKRLKAAGCETDTTGTCGESVLEDPTQVLRYVGPDTALADNINLPALFQGSQSTNQQTGLTRNYKEKVSGTKFVNGVAVRFNPIVLKEAILPDGSKYSFEYNIYGEINSITYPTGAIERFTYGPITPMGYSMGVTYDSANRGVLQRTVYLDEQAVVNQTPYQTWTYEAQDSTSGYKVTITAPDQSRTESLLHKSYGYGYGFSNSISGRMFDRKVYSAPDSSGIKRLVSRELTQWKQDGPLPGGYSDATRDPRPERTVSILVEEGKALATMSETDYETPGENQSTAPTDRSYFARLNPKQVKGYHFLPLTVTQADQLDINDVKALFYQSGQVASIVQTDYLYDSAQRARGIIGLPEETRSLNPINPSDVLARSRYLYDEELYFDNTYTTTNWVDPASGIRGNPTTTRRWVKETNTWLDSHTMFDNFGNVRKLWDVSADENKFVETQYSSSFKYAYPTRVIAPAPELSSTNAHGTTQTSIADTNYDLQTGLPISVTNDFGQVTTTEYDSLLRPVRVNPVVVSGQPTGPVAETIYGVPDSNGQFPSSQRYVKVRKQLDATNWDEATTLFDSLGRTITTQAKDSQGDVFGDTVYDNMGRVERVTNPYRSGDAIYWSKTRYDTVGRAIESYAPVLIGSLESAPSLGLTSFSISSVTNFVGTVVTTTDASGRKGRSITNALGQLLRVDEPTGIGASSTTDLGDISTPLQPTIYKYDAYGSMVHVQQGQQNRYFKYDSLGRLLRVQQPEQEINTSLNLADPGTGNSSWTAGFTYDILGNVLTATDANNVTITNTYDRASRVKNRSYSDTTPAVNFYYDGVGLDSLPSPNYSKGKLTKVENTISQTRYTLFDKFGRLLSSEQRTPQTGETVSSATPRTSSYVYNLSGALIQETYPSGRVVSIELESDGDLSRIYGRANPGASERVFASGFGYLPDGRIERLKLGNALWERARFNERLQVTELALGHGVEVGDVWKLGYEYGEALSDGTVDTAKNTGSIARQTLSFSGLTHPFIQTYKYDSLYRLKEARETRNSNQTWKQIFDYDRYGNRTAFTQDVGGQQLQITNLTLPTVDAATNRFADNQGYLYDKNGNLKNDPVGGNRQFVFSGDNKQTEIKDANGALIGEYFYDGEGRRVKKKAYSGGVFVEETVFIYSNSKLVADYTSAAPVQNPTTSYTVTDQLGSPRVLVNALGSVVSRRDFMPFGEEVEPDASNRTAGLKYGTGDSVRQKFTGYQKDDESQLDFAEARMYERRHGRFTAIDPLLSSGKPQSPQTFNRFIYVANNPLAFTDPSGLQAGDYSGAVYSRRDQDGSVGFSRNNCDGCELFNEYKVDDAVDGYRYYITPNGWTQLGKTSELIENDQSDSQSILVGLMRFANRGFNMPMSAPGTPYNPSGPTIRGITGFQPFSDEATQTYTWRDWGIATGTEISVDAIGARGLGRFGTASSGLSATARSTSLIGVPESSLSRLVARLEGLNIGGQKVVGGVEAFGSRAGSQFRGRGPLPSSDLDVMITERAPFHVWGSRNEKFLSKRLDQIATDFQAEAGFPVNFSFSRQRKSLDGPFVPINSGQRR